MKFDRQAFEEWFVENAQTIYELTGIAHYNASNIGLLKVVFIQEQRIRALENPPKRAKRKASQ